MAYNKIIVIGAGLIGASFIKALQNKNIAKEIIALVRNQENINLLQQLNITASNDYNIVEQADLIFIAAPLAAYQAIFKQLAQKQLKENVIISDIGSVKGYVEELAQEILPQYNFVPAHPIAGSHQSGTGTIIDGLFDNKKLIITAHQSDNAELIANIWQEIGMKVEYLSANEHDRIYAYISHLIQKIAFALPNDLKAITRLSKSSPLIWQEIFEFNQKALKKASYEFINKLLSSDEALNCAERILISLNDIIPNEFINYAGTGYQSLIQDLDNGKNLSNQTNQIEEFISDFNNL